MAPIVRPTPRAWRAGWSEPASTPSRCRSSIRRRSCASRRSRSVGSSRSRTPASGCPRSSTWRCRTIGSRCARGSSTGRAGIYACDPTPPRRCRWPRCPVGRGLPLTSTRRRVSRSPAARERSPPPWRPGSPHRACPSVRPSSRSSPSALVTRTDRSNPAHTGPGYSDIALVANHPFALDLIETIEAQGLSLQQFHPEYADGQFELSIAPRDPVAAADAAMVLRQTVRAVARRHGWIDVVRATRRSRHRERLAPAPQPLGRGAQPALRRGGARGDGSPRGGVHGGHPAIAARLWSRSRRRRSPATCGSSRITGRARCSAGVSRTARPRSGSSRGPRRRPRARRTSR